MVFGIKFLMEAFKFQVRKDCLALWAGLFEAGLTEITSVFKRWIALSTIIFNEFKLHYYRTERVLNSADYSISRFISINPTDIFMKTLVKAAG